MVPHCAHNSPWAWICKSLVALGITLAGCAPVASDDLVADAVPEDPHTATASTTKPVATSYHQEQECNDTFEQAESLADISTLELSGTIAAGAAGVDRDVFMLDGARAGDRIQIDLTVHNGMDVVVGLLDAEQHLLAYLDPFNPITGPDHIDLTLQAPTSNLYLTVATHAAVSAARAYTVTFTRRTDESILGYHPQTLVLNFSGASQVCIGNRPPVDVPSFDAAAIDPRFAGLTEDIIQLVLQKVREDYAGLTIAIYRDGDPAIPPTDYSTLHFGTYDPRLLGLAEEIDPYNSEPAQQAILFTDTFALFKVLRPTQDQIAQVLANVASHEAGHLLGLRHTVDPVDLMDVTATARQMLGDQTFGVARLADAVLPLGFQDAPQLLAWSLGGALTQQDKTRQLAQRRLSPAEPATGELDFYISRETLGTGCGHADAHH